MKIAFIYTFVIKHGPTQYLGGFGENDDIRVGWSFWNDRTYILLEYQMNITSILVGFQCSYICQKPFFQSGRFHTMYIYSKLFKSFLLKTEKSGACTIKWKFLVGYWLNLAFYLFYKTEKVLFPSWRYERNKIVRMKVSSSLDLAPTGLQMFWSLQHSEIVEHSERILVEQFMYVRIFHKW